MYQKRYNVNLYLLTRLSACYLALARFPFDGIKGARAESEFETPPFSDIGIRGAGRAAAG
jgi:hypothetical protein